MEFTSEMNVDLIDYMGSDDRIIQAARVSTLTDLIDIEDNKLIGFLMRERHGSPFEHVVMTFRVEAPIFVWREFMRHRIASYNEQSGRYSVMPAKFYIPGPERNLVQIGKPGHYDFVPGTPDQYGILIQGMKANNKKIYQDYQERLDMGIAKEVARMDLPLNMYSTAYVTMNTRALMNFLSLRVKSDDSAYKSYPQQEINMVANIMEEYFADIAPTVHANFVKHGRVAP